jgi:hypothetical protein
LPHSVADSLQGAAITQLRERGHSLGGEHAAALQLPVLVLLQQYRPRQAGDRGGVGETTHDPGTVLDLLVDAFRQVGAPNLFPVGLREVAEGQHSFLERNGLWEALRQRGGQIIPARLSQRTIHLAIDIPSVHRPG